MVHNGIEYGIMAAYAEGLNILHSANVGKEVLEGDAETAPMEHPEYYQYDIDTREVTEVWRRGSVVSSWLLDLTAQALFESPTLEDFSGRVSDSGRGALDLDRGDRRGRPGAGADDRAGVAVCLAGAR